jgi:hypothetical protein
MNLGAIHTAKMITVVTEMIVMMIQNVAVADEIGAYLCLTIRAEQRDPHPFLANNLDICPLQKKIQSDF